MTEPLPCPWCGLKPDKVMNGDYYYITCRKITCTVRPRTDFYTRGYRAVAAWNRRKT